MAGRMMVTRSEKRKVRLYDIHPGANPRKDFGNIRALAEAIRATGGDPINPLVVVEDGTCEGEPQYRLVDGERRWRALQQIHNTAWETDAIVFDTYDEANTAIAMLATDDKKPLNDDEIATGFQQMLKLDVEDVRIAQALNRKPDEIRRARKVAATATRQCTLDQLIAAGEFDDEDDRKKVFAADPVELPRVVRSLRQGVERRRNLAEVRGRAEELGLKVLPERPEGSVFDRSVYTLDDLEECVDAIDADWHFLWLNRSYDGSAYSYQIGHPECEETPEEREQRERDERDRERIERLYAIKRAFSESLIRLTATAGHVVWPTLTTIAGRERNVSEWGTPLGVRQSLDRQIPDAQGVWKLATMSPASDYELVLWAYELRNANDASVRGAMEAASGDGYMLSDDELWFLGQTSEDGAGAAEEGDQ